jgi:hypothetical protein
MDARRTARNHACRSRGASHMVCAGASISECCVEERMSDAAALLSSITPGARRESIIDKHAWCVV